MRTHLLIASAVVLLSASTSTCGHDSGSDPGPGPTAADVDPPSLVALVPAPGDANVWVHAPIAATFSEPVQVPADRTVVLALTGGGSIETTVHRSEDGKSLTIVPDSLPPPSSQVTVNLRAPITDLAGNAAAIPAWSWIVPQWQHTGPPLKTGPDFVSLELAAAADGTVFAAHQYAAAEFIEAHAVSVEKVEAGAWTSLAPPPVMPYAYFGCPIAVGLDGMPIVAQRGRDAIRVDRYDGAAWQRIGEPLAAGPLSSPYRLRMVLDAAGHPVLAWANVGENGPTIAAARWDGTAWQSLGEQPGGPIFDLAASLDGTVALAMSDGTTLTLARFDATRLMRWNVAAGIQELSLAFDEDGTEVVATVDPAGAVHVLRWAGTTYMPQFRELGASPSSGGRHVAIRSRPSGRPGARLVLSFLEAGPRVLGWDGEGWVPLAREIATPSGPLYTADDIGSWVLTVSPAGDLVYAWGEDEEQNWQTVDVFVVRYNE